MNASHLSRIVYIAGLQVVARRRWSAAALVPVNVGVLRVCVCKYRACPRVGVRLHPRARQPEEKLYPEHTLLCYN